MPVMDEFKEERAAMRHGTPKQKLTYFFDYYKWHVVSGVIILIFAGALIYQIATHKDIAFYAMLLNASAYGYPEQAESTAGFAEYTGTDTEKYDIIYDATVKLGTDGATDYQAAQKLMVQITAADLDVIVSDGDSLLEYAYMGDFYDLRNFLTAEQMEAYKNSFYYVDGAVMEEIESSKKAYDYEYVPVYSDPRHPEDMQDPIPVGIFLKEDCPLLQEYVFLDNPPAVSVLINTKRPEMASSFIDFLMQ